MISYFQKRWVARGGYREVLAMAVPLALSTGTISIQHFVDRVLLSRYSTDAVAATLPAALSSFTLISLFMGTASYATTFVAQYFGAGRDERVGPALWQALYLAFLAMAILPLAHFIAEPYFRLVGHSASVQAEEVIYFRILMWGAGLPVYGAAISCFYTGRGKNWPIMWVNVGVTAINVLVNYALIFGNWGFPEMGIRGAAIGTVTGTFFGAVAYTVMIFGSRDRKRFCLLSGWRFDRELFGRLMRFGFPSGVQFMLDIMAFTFFLNLLGRLGTVELAASNIVFSINQLAFMPMIGFGIATSAMVGQYLGKDDPDLASRSNWSAFHLTMSYMVTITLFYIFTPRLFLAPFTPEPEVAALSRQLLYFVAIYCIFDTLCIIFSSTLKGAGDTRFVMLISLGTAWGLMFFPTWFMCGYLGFGIYTAWTFLSICIISMGFAYLWRLMGGKWRDMRVIEAVAPPPVPPELAATPTTVDADL
ncbi:MAG: MATE family efflux transporter [Candidatus Sumerlaeia bacterium]